MMAENTYYHYLSSLRQGLSTGVTDPVAPNKLRLSVNIDLNVDIGAEQPEAFNQPMELYGPYDVLGFESAVVNRTEPLNNVGDFEPNYFPFIEFSEVDYPWRFTPLISANGELPPWLTLIVLVDEEVKKNEQVKQKEILGEGQYPDTKVRWIEVNTNHLPDLAQASRWSHVQVTAGEVDSEKIKNIIKNEPERAVSRLMCPRRLRPGVKYRAFVVPTYKAGVIRAENSSVPEGFSASKLSWDLSEGNDRNKKINLPYYYSWEFRTGLRGDFEHLIRLLEPRPLEDLGKADVDCSAPGFGIGDEQSLILGFESALRSEYTTPTKWGMDSDEPDNAYRQELAELVNRGDDYIVTPEDDDDEDPVVTPPIYGRWHRGREDAVSADTNDWLDELNLDPRHRAASGVGAEVIRENQEQLMASAWDQLDDIQTANDILRRAQLGKEISTRIESRFKKLLPENYLRITGKLHSRIKLDGQSTTLATQLSDSKIGSAAFDMGLRKVTRKRGHLRKRQQTGGRSFDNFMSRLNTDDIKVADSNITSQGLLSLSNIQTLVDVRDAPSIDVRYSSKVHTGELDISFNYAQRRTNEALTIALKDDHGWIQIKDNGDGTARLYGQPPVIDLRRSALLKNKTIPVVISIQQGSKRKTQKQIDLTLRTETRRNQIVTKWKVTKVSQEKKSYTIPDHIGRISDIKIPTAAIEAINETLQNYEQGSSVRAVGENIRNVMQPNEWLFLDEKEEKPAIADLSHLDVNVKEKVDPTISMAKRVSRLIMLPEKITPKEGHELDQILVEPEFPQPMYISMQSLSQDYLLRGIEKIPQNSVGILYTNPRFIEAYMAGLQTEMARELVLARDYPMASMRGTYFKQFWDTSDAMMLAENKSINKDDLITCYLDHYKLKPIDEWTDDAKQSFVDLYIDEYVGISDKDLQEQFVFILAQRSFEMTLHDIKPMVDWNAKRLGKNGNDFCGEEDAEPKLVLVIRGDLLKKYPNTLIYAVKKGVSDLPEYEGITVPSLNEFTDKEDGDKEFPVFGAYAKPDMTFLGFNISQQSARSGDWFFCIEQCIGENRFGLDINGAEVTDVDSYSWESFNLKNSFDAYINASVPNVNDDYDYANEWNGDASAIAKCSMQKPVRMIISIKQLLPETESA